MSSVILFSQLAKYQAVVKISFVFYGAQVCHFWFSLSFSNLQPIKINAFWKRLTDIISLVTFPGS